MPLGPGKYDAECAVAREACQAEGAILIVINGRRGTGFSAKTPLHVAVALPELLRYVADEMEKSLRKGTL